MEDDHAESNVTESITRTVVTRTDYTSSGGGGGDATLDVRDSLDTDALFYDVSDSVNAGVLLSSGSRAVANFERAQDDLSNFKKRIDANTEEQREHADLMADLQRKIEEYRRRIADIENQVAGPNAYENVVFNLKEISEAWMPDLSAVDIGLKSTALLEEERRRNNELRMQIAQQQIEIQRLRQQFEMNMQDKDKAYRIREQNLAQYLGEEQQKMISLWGELQQVREQFADYREQTERDLENQRNEFARVTRNVGGVVRKLSITSLGMERGSIKDDDVIDALKRFRDHQISPIVGASADEYNELMKKYQESIERIVDLESRRDGSAGKVSALEAELKRTRQKLNESQDALRRLNEMAKDADTKSGLKKRPRSLSPGSAHIAPSEVVRNVRYVLRTHDNELQQLQRNLKNAELQIAEMTNRFESVEEVRKRLEKQLNDAKKDISNSNKSLDEATRENKRLEERLRSLDSEIANAGGERIKLEDEIRRLKTIIDQTDVDSARKALEDAEAQNHLIDEEYKARVTELMRRIDVIQDDNKRLKSDLAAVKDKHRILETEHNSTLRKINEKDMAIENLENLKTNLLKDLENQRARFDAVSSELDSVQANLDSKTKTTVAVETSVKEIKRQCDDISKEKEELSKRVVELSRRLAIEIKKREDIESAGKRNVDEIMRLKEQIADCDKQVMILRGCNEEQDTKLKIGIARITTLENSLASAQNEITKLTELNNKLQNEKQDIMNVRQKTDVELDTVKDKLRKLKQEIEKVKLENTALHDSEEKAQKAYKEEANKVQQLALELKEAGAEINELERKVAQLTQDNERRLENVLQTKSSDRVDSYEITEITETKVKQLDDKHKLDVQKIENEKDELARRLRLVEDELNEKQHTIETQQIEIADLKSRYEVEIERMKAEMKEITAKYQNELDDERDQHSHEMETIKARKDEFCNKIAQLEKKLEDAENQEGHLQKEIIEWQEKYDEIQKDLQNVRDQLENTRIDAEKDIQKWKNDLCKTQMEMKNVETINETLRSQSAIANERVNSLNKTVNDQTAKITELSTEVRRLEDELSDSKATVTATEADLEDALRRLKSAEEQYSTLHLENNKIIAEIDALKRKVDVLNNTNASNESDNERLKKKNTQLSITNKEQLNEIEKLQNERDVLERNCREKTKLADQLNESVKTLELKVERTHQELQNLNDKLVVSESEKNALRTQVKKLEQELQFGKDVIIRKTDEFHAALDDLANAHRSAESGRVNALQELETRKFEVADLQSRLSNAEQRLGVLQQEYLNADKEREMLNDSLRRFQYAISRTVIPEIGAPSDIQTIDVHVQKLIARIEKLQRERNQYRDSLNRLQRKTSDSHIAINKHENLYKSIEEKVVDLEEEKRSLELRLASAKEVLRSQEDALKQRDDERHTMKQKIITFELETRSKDAQIRHLNELVRTLRTDLENTQNDNRVLRDREEQWDTKKILLENKVRDQDGEVQKINMLMASFETERQNLNDSVKKLSSQLLKSEANNADLKDNADRLKRDLAKAERTEIDLRRSLEEQTRIARECQHLRDQLGIAQNDLSSANNRKQQLESELLNVRGELYDNKQNLRDATTRLTEMDKHLQNALSDKNRLNDRISELEKVISAGRVTESELRQKLINATNEMKVVQRELQDLQRRIAQFEDYKRSANEKIEDMKKNRLTLTKRIEILESEKRSAESLMNETALQREAIERSLSALERENKELYRNCSQLQQQVAQLEMDNGSRLMALTSKQKEEHERFVEAVKAEKTQFERIVENRDRLQKTRIKQLENQLNIIREQLSNERLRNRDVTNRMIISDMSKLGGSIFGSSSSTGTMSAGANAYPHSGTFDYLIGSGSGSGFATQYMTPPPIRSLSPIRDVYQPSSTLIKLKDPDPAVHPSHMVVGEEIKLVEDVDKDGEDVQKDVKRTTIVVHMKGTKMEPEIASDE